MEEEEIDYYAILNATIDEIRAAYKRLALTFHPDSHAGGGDGARVEGATQQFRLIKEAYECLSDEGQRGVYDLYGVAGLRGGWAVGAKYPTVEELQRAWAKQQRRLATEQFLADTGIKATCACHVSVADSWDPLYHHYRLPELRAVHLRQRVHTPLGRGHVTVEGAVGSDYGNGRGDLSLTFQHPWGSLGQWTALGRVGTSGAHSSVAFTRSLSRDLSGSVSLGLGGGGSLASVGLQRHLQGGALLQMGWSVSSSRDQGFGHVGVAVPFGGATVSVGVRVPETGDSGTAEVSVTHHLSRDYRVTVRCEGSYPRGAEVDVSAERQWGRYSAVGVGVGGGEGGLFLRVFYKRGGLKFAVPVHLSHHVTLPSLVGLFLGVGVGVGVVERFVCQPFWEARRRAKVAQERAARREELSRQQSAAQSAVSLMTPAVQRKRRAEEERGGVVIVQGWYGVLENGENSPTVIGLSCLLLMSDVTIPLQYLVEDSRLRLHETSKANLLGFWDPAYGEEKHLYVRYLFKDQLHQVTIGDSEPLAIPRKADLIQTN